MKRVFEFISHHLSTVIAGLVPAIHTHRAAVGSMDGRDEPGHDGVGGAGVSRLALVLVLGLSLGLAGCGVKSDLVTPDGKPTPKGQKDPSKPPAQQQQGL